MLEWLKNINKDYPDFWKRYLLKFEKKSNRYVALKLESSGENSEKDIVLSIGALGVENNSIVVNDAFDVVMMQYKYIHDNGLVNEYIVHKSKNKTSEQIAIQQFIDYIGNAVLVGYHINATIEMINQSLDKINCGRIKNEAFDVEVMYKKIHEITDKSFSLDKLFKINKIQQNEFESPFEDAFSIALLFLKFKAKLKL